MTVSIVVNNSGNKSPLDKILLLILLKEFKNWFYIYTSKTVEQDYDVHVYLLSLIIFTQYPANRDQCNCCNDNLVIKFTDFFILKVV